MRGDNFREVKPAFAQTLILGFSGIWPDMFASPDAFVIQHDGETLTKVCPRCSEKFRFRKRDMTGMQPIYCTDCTRY